MSDDGGRYALAGYLYQVLGYYTLIASTREKTSPENALDLTLGFEMRGARHEVHGQDALLTGIGEAGKERALLVQFKYSTRPRTYPITRSELLEIADSLHASASSAPELQGAEVAYRLVSNRSLDENAEDALKNVEAVSAKGHHKGLPDTLRRIRYRYLDEDIVHRTLKTYADQLGVLDSEFDDGIERLAGRLLMSTASMQRRTLTLADLAKGLSNCDDPRPLVGANIEDVLRQETRLFRRTARLPGGLMRRDITARIERSFDHPLILVHGDGGCGKTAAVYSIVDEALNHSGTIRFFVRMDLASVLSLK